MKKTTIYGLPLNPISALEQLKGASFCVSYATRKKLGRQLDQAMELVGEDGILLVDNGAYSHFNSGGQMTDDYIEGFGEWANEILEACPQAVAVLPDIIGGTVEENAKLVTETMTMFPEDRVMAMWHMDEPISFLLHLCEGFNHVGIGSSGKFATVGAGWDERMAEAMAAVDKWEAESGDIRPRFHLMRAQRKAHLVAVDSSDSTNVAMNHNRQFKKHGATVAQFAARIDTVIQKSAGPEAEHQIKRPLLYHVEAEAKTLEWQFFSMIEAMNYKVEMKEAA